MGGVLFKNVTFLQLVKKFPALFEGRKIITAFTSYIPFPILKCIPQLICLNIHFHILLPPTLSSYKWPLSLSTTLCQPLVSHTFNTCHLSSSLDPLYSVKNTDHECSHFAASCSLLLPRTSYAQIPSSLSCSQTPTALKKEQN
jgi:hypothetical protein